MMLSGLTKTHGIMSFLWVSLIFIMGELPRLSSRAMAEDNRSHSTIEKISVNRSTVTIEGRCDIESERPRFLAELAPHHSKNDLANAQIIQQVELDETGFFRMSFPRWSDDRDRILSRFFLTSSHSQPFKKLTRLLWASEVSDAAVHQNLEPAKAKTVKGLGGIHPDPRLFDDLVELGVGHLTVNITLNSLLRTEREGNITRQYGEKEFYFNPTYIRQLDRLLKFAHQNQMVVSAIILVPRTTRDHILGEVLVHPDATDGHYTLANVVTPEGVQYYSGCMRFLAERYGPIDLPNGRITHWIIHNEVDAAWVWTNAGEKTDVEFMEQYTRSLRIAYFSVRSYDPHAQVFITLTHHWNESHRPNPRRFYRSRRLMELLALDTEHHGDFEWGVAFHPYPENLFNPRTWLDRKSDDHFETAQITFKNIHVLDRWMKQDNYLYLGKKLRTILLSEQGFHSSDDSSVSQQLQAAALAYAWKKIKPLDSIQAFHYHRWIDHEREGGLNLGLWTVQPGSITWPKDKKLSWEVFRALDTIDESTQTQFALPILKIEDWQEIAPHADSSK